MGNRTAVWQHGALVGSWTSNAANQVLSWRSAAAGNLLRDNTASYRYDVLGRLTRVTSGGATTASTSNGDGVLVAAERGAGITPFTQDLAAPLSQVLQQTPGTTTTSVLSGHARLAAVQHGTRSWELHDGLGSVRLLLDEAGEVQPSLGYDPWGVPVAGSPAPFGFTGELQDASAGLVYLRARWYQPGTGRFLTRDPFEGWINQPASLHPYQYAANSPINRTDPSGRCYGALTRLPEVEVEAEWCRNLDKAVLIYTNPNTTWDQRAWAYSYATSWYVGHAALVVPLLLAGEAAVGWIMVQGAAYLATHSMAAIGLGAAAVVASVADDIGLAITNLVGTPEDRADAYNAYQIGAADGQLPFADTIAACNIVGLVFKGRPGGIPLRPGRFARAKYAPKGLWPEIRSLLRADGTLEPGTYIFAVDMQGNMYLAKDREIRVGPHGTRYAANHGQLVGGENVYGAGEVTIGPDGKVDTIKDATGHYGGNFPPDPRPAKELLEYPKGIFEQLGLWKPDSKMIDYGVNKQIQE